MKKILLLFLAFFVFAGLPSVSKAASNDELLRQIKMLQQKLAELEKKVEKQQSSIEETKKNQEEIKEASDMLKTLKDHISIGGTVEVESNFTGIDRKGASGDSSSDITLATAELDMEAKLHKYASANLVFLWEEDDTEPVDIDEGYITLGNTDYFPLYLKAGRMYVPFGNFETNFVSDPLTLELGEIQESAYLFGAAYKGVDFSVYFFNPDIDENKDKNADIIKSWGATLSFDFADFIPEDYSLNIQVSYLNNIADTNDFKDAFDDNGWTKSVKDYSSGFHAFLMAEGFGFNFIAEYLGATDDFDKTDFGGIGKKFQPETWNLELGYTFSYLKGKEMTVAVKYEGSNDAAFIDPDLFMEKQYGIAISANLFSSEKWGTNVNLNVEYLHGEADDDIVKLIGGYTDSKD
jgi:hypothetical protein